MQSFDGNPITCYASSDHTGDFLRRKRVDDARRMRRRPTGRGWTVAVKSPPQFMIQNTPSCALRDKNGPQSGRPAPKPNRLLAPQFGLLWSLS